MSVLAKLSAIQPDQHTSPNPDVLRTDPKLKMVSQLVGRIIDSKVMLDKLDSTRRSLTDTQKGRRRDTMLQMQGKTSLLLSETFRFPVKSSRLATRLQQPTARTYSMAKESFCSKLS